MIRVPNRLIDPATGEIWDWPINHHDESGSKGLVRNFTVSAPTSLNIRIRQQASNTPMATSWKGTALTRAQHQKFIHWWLKCEHNSLILRDFSGDQYEVMITSYVPTRRATAQNRNDMANAPTWVYDYQIDFDIINVISGDYVGIVA